MKKFLAIFLAFINIFIFTSLPAHAASMNAFIDAPSSVAKGKNFTVSVRFESEIDAYITATFSYDENVVEYVSCSSSGVNKVGNHFNIVPSSCETSHKFDFVFKMKDTKVASFSAKVTESYDIDLNSLGTPSAKASISGIIPTAAPTKAPTVRPTTKPTATVKPTAKPTATVKPTAKPTAKPTEKPTVKPTENTTATPSVNTSSPSPSSTPIATTVPSVTPENSMEFLYNNEIRYISEDFDEDKVNIPTGFEKKAYNFKNNNIFIVTNDQEIIMVYATNVLGQDGKFFMYNAEKNTFTLYSEYSFNDNNYVFTTPLNVPDFLTLTTALKDTFKDCAAYTLPSTQHSEFVLLYGFIPGNTPSYYIYDTVEKTLQRCPDIEIYNISNSEINIQNPLSTNEPLSPESTSTVSSPNVNNAQKKDDNSKTKESNVWSKILNFAKKNIILICIGLSVILLILSIIFIFAFSGKNKKEINLDDYFDDDFNQFLEQSNAHDNTFEKTENIAEKESEFVDEPRQNTEFETTVSNFDSLNDNEYDDDDEDDNLHL